MTTGKLEPASPVCINMMSEMEKLIVHGTEEDQ